MKKILILMMFLSPKLFAYNCDGLAIAKTLDSLTDVTRFHNCTIEVLKIETEELRDEVSVPLVSYLVYGKDQFRCKNSEFCPEANYEITLKKECLSKKIDLHDVERNSNGYNLDKKQIRNHMQIKFNLDLEPIEIAFGQTDLADVKRINHVKCELNPLSGK